MVRSYEEARRRQRVVLLLVWLLVMVPFAVALPLAFFQHPSDPIVGLPVLIQPLVMPWLVPWFRYHEYRALPQADRKRVREAQYYGRSSGEPRLDRLALARLRDQAAEERTSNKMSLVFVAAFIVVLALAAYRHGPLWLLPIVPLILLVGRAWRRRRDRPIAERLERFEAAVGPGGEKDSKMERSAP